MLAAVLNWRSDDALAGGALRNLRARVASTGHVPQWSFQYSRGSDFLGTVPSFRYAFTTDSGDKAELSESDFSWISSPQYFQSRDDEESHVFLCEGP